MAGPYFIPLQAVELKGGRGCYETGQGNARGENQAYAFYPANGGSQPKNSFRERGGKERNHFRGNPAK